jgi:hypothetical protein
MKTRTKVASVLAVAALLVGAVPAFADGPDVVVTIDGNTWHYDGTENPLARLHNAWILPCGADPQRNESWKYYYVYPHPDNITVVEDFRIAAVYYTWHLGPNGREDNYGYATVTCDGSPNPLVTMYVAYSKEPFFGQTHTITLMSELGPPSKDRVAYWAGVAPDALPMYTFPCSDVVYDDGTDQGIFSCDVFLNSVGERRAWLRNDPQGPDTDLLPKIRKYLSQLDRLVPSP